MTSTLRIAYWPATVIATALFAIPGAALIARAPHFAAEMARLGYPGYFMILLGSFKVAGAAVILAPRLPVLKEWAYAGLSFDVIGAIASRISVGDPPVTVGLPILIGALLALSWALRPAARRLGAFSPPAAQEVMP